MSGWLGLRSKASMPNRCSELDLKAAISWLFLESHMLRDHLFKLNISQKQNNSFQDPVSIKQMSLLVTCGFCLAQCDSKYEHRYNQLEKCVWLYHVLGMSVVFFF